MRHNLPSEFMSESNMRNFSIIAHVDHGKSTLTDRIPELTDALSPWGKVKQVLDSMVVIPKQLFEVVIRVATGSKITVRESIKPLKENVLVKCYGGDITKKRKLLEKQKEGNVKGTGKNLIKNKRRLARIG